ncbi:hypothetical protein BDN71DRAFT_1386696, partial [Pleurotus eryngii]
HIPLAMHLHRIKQAEMATCQQCGLYDKMVNHFITQCRTFQHSKEKLKAQTGRDVLYID